MPFIDTPPPSTAFARIKLTSGRLAVPQAFALQFDAQAFREGDFSLHGIPRPASIARSVAKRQAEYLAGRRVALASLRDVGHYGNDLPMGRDRAPDWPPGVIGSISHTTGLAVAVALTTDSGVRGIGLDIERLISTEQMSAVQATVIDSVEHANLALLAARMGWPFALTVAFSAKESFYKATAATVGHIFDFAALKIIACDADAGHLDAQVVEDLAPPLSIGHRQRLRWQSLPGGIILTHCIW